MLHQIQFCPLRESNLLSADSTDQFDGSQLPLDDTKLSQHLNKNVESFEADYVLIQTARGLSKSSKTQT